MSARGLIIAIETYPSAEGLAAQNLAGTHDAAKNFLHWLVDDKGLAERDIFVNSDAPTFPIADSQLRGANSDDIAQSIESLVNGKGQTEQLFVYFSGHGFFLIDKVGDLTDILVTREYRNLKASGRACIDLGEVQSRLRLWMGPGEHFYFIDACRNEQKSSDVQPAGLGLNFDIAGGDPTVFTLYSTRRRFAAATNSGFATLVGDGLVGKSRAKKWDGPRMAVFFDSLAEYVKTNLGAQEADKDVTGMGAGRLLDIDPIPHKSCRLVVENAAKTDAFTLEVRDNFQHVLREPDGFVGDEFSFPNTPGDYVLQVRHPTFQVMPSTQSVDLYEDAEVRFRVVHDEPPGPVLTAEPVTVHVESDALVQIARADDACYVVDVDATATIVPPGAYHVTVRDPRGGWLAKRHAIELTAGSDIDLGAFTLAASSSADATTRSIFAEDETTLKDVVQFEEMGTIVDGDTAILLAVLGASRIVADQSTLTNTSELPLWDASGVAEGGAPLYVLAEMESWRSDGLRFGMWPGPEDVPARGVGGVAGLFEATFDGIVGPGYLTVRVDDAPATTFVTHSLANRCTLVTLTCDTRGQLRFGQFILPIAHLREKLDVASYLPQPNMYQTVPNRGSVDIGFIDSVRFMAQAQRSFAAHDAVTPTQGQDLSYWNDLLYDKWLDPVMGVIAAYELVRRGQQDTLGPVLDNLRRYFRGLPDTEVLAKFIGRENAPQTSPPMLLEGMLALGAAEYDGMPPNRLDYRATWTSWIGAEPKR